MRIGGNTAASIRSQPSSKCQGCSPPKFSSAILILIPKQEEPRWIHFSTLPPTWPNDISCHSVWWCATCHFKHFLATFDRGMDPAEKVVLDNMNFFIHCGREWAGKGNCGDSTENTLTLEKKSKGVLMQKEHSVKTKQKKSTLIFTDELETIVKIHLDNSLIIWGSLSEVLWGGWFKKEQRGVSFSTDFYNTEAKLYHLCNFSHSLGTDGFNIHAGINTLPF